MDFAKENYPIDVVVLWVDGADEAWLREKASYTGESFSCDNAARYRDWGNLKYLFRGIERFWPWVNKVFFITNGQRPAWLDTECDRLRLVTHSEFMPAEHLPTFNSNAIELNLHNIEELSEHFILMNDDFFPLRPLPRTDFFRGGLPCDFAQMEQLYCIKSKSGFGIEVMDFCNLGLLNNHFRKKLVCNRHNWRKWYGPYLGLTGILRNLAKWNHYFFVGFENRHSAQSFRKSTFSEVWAAEPDYLAATSASRVRHDTNVTQYLMRYWQLAKNEFVPNRFDGRKYFYIGDDSIADIVKCVQKQAADIVCLNDTEEAVMTDFDGLKERINAAFLQILPEKSMFEK